jgi:hypothetical protein
MFQIDELIKMFVLVTNLIWSKEMGHLTAVMFGEVCPVMH